MMRFLILSDTHRNIDRASRLIERFQDQIDGVWHLGDNIQDLNKLEKLFRPKYPHLAFQAVPGNCDYTSFELQERVIPVEGLKVLMCHGHHYSVRHSTELLRQRAWALGCRIALYGHTHIPLIEESESCLVLNPGSLSEPRGGSKPSFALLEMNKGQFFGVIHAYHDFFPDENEISD